MAEPALLPLAPQIFQNFAYLHPDRALRVFAGGGVACPKPPALELRQPGQEDKLLCLLGGHPSAGMCRQIGFPLAQEVCSI